LRDAFRDLQTIRNRFTKKPLDDNNIGDATSFSFSNGIVHTYTHTMSSSSSSTNQKKIAVVTGSSSGIGYHASLALARNGFLTYATMRNLGKSEAIKSAAAKEGLPIRAVQLDVTDDRSVKNAIQSILSDAGRIDVLVNNAGYGLTGAFEDIAMDEMKALYETNVFGLTRVAQAALPAMRKQGSGTIINISSGAGRFGYPGGSAYVSTKFAVEGLTESMAFELEQFGIKAVLVEPGFIKTDFARNAVIAGKAQDPNSPYAPMMQMLSSSVGRMLENGSSPELVANAVVEAATSRNPRLRYVVGKDLEQWVAGRKSMSDEEFSTMIKQGLKRG
jgi:NAD(P)-dependent dehydrogenase (short-subunit alcohol dehydrogenase family)